MHNKSLETNVEAMLNRQQRRRERWAHLKRAIATGGMALTLVGLGVGYCQLCEIFGPIVALIGGVGLFCWACWKLTERS